MYDYLGTIQKASQTIHLSPHLVVKEDRIFEGLGTDYISDFLRSEGCDAPEDYIQFCSAVDFAHIEWEVKPDSIRSLGLEASMCTTGRIFIDSIENVFAPGFWLNEIWNEFQHIHQLNVGSRLIPVDYFDPDNSACICYEMKNKKIGPGLFYFDHREGLLPLDISLDAYFEKLLSYRGVYGWQKALLGGNTQYVAQTTSFIKKIFNETISG
ncbi:MAG TPA: hypothetical protein VFU15_14250 [Bacteroidia bacterium]|nr:hypothetical protein [Bacteroidia bacterium]